MKDQETACKNVLEETTDNTEIRSKCDKKQHSNRVAYALAPVDDKSVCQLSDWVKSRLTECKGIQEDSEES